MNKERILQLAAHIETLNHVGLQSLKDSLPENGFNMSRYSFRNSKEGCKTPSCAAGWTVFLWDRVHYPFTTNYLTESAELLGIPIEEAHELFHPQASWYRTPKETAQVLREFAETGVVNWRYLDTNDVRQRDRNPG